jgi:hypothetical protein
LLAFGLELPAKDTAAPTLLALEELWFELEALEDPPTLTPL